MDSAPESASEIRKNRAPGAKPFSARLPLLLLILLLLIAVPLLILSYYARRKHVPLSPMKLPELLAPAKDPYAAAVKSVQEERGEKVGREAQFNVPAELKLYSNRKRFLAIQVAEWRKQGYEIPQDFPELALMEQKGDFVRVPVIGPGYILYGVGVKANDELTHYDQAKGQSVPIFGSEAELQQEQSDLADSLKQFEDKVKELKKELQQAAKKRDRNAQKSLQTQISDAQKEAEPLKKRKEMLDSFYKSAENRQRMLREYETLSTLASDFNGKAYDLTDANARKDFKVALLSYLRAPALSMLQAIGQLYERKFERPLPVTSLVRTKEYQRYLNEAGNPNATQIDVPPHTTGLAFDIYTHYMTGAEQQFLMDTIARLKKEGKVEALRENRDHIHVFAFPDGVPPDETLIKKMLGHMQSQD